MVKLDKIEKHNKKNDKSFKVDRRAKQTLKTLELINNSAIKLFNIKNFNEITMEEIADQADISRATLYNHFKSKEEIYFIIASERFRIVNNSLKTLLIEPMTGFDIIKMLCSNLLNRMVEDPTASKIVYILLSNDKLKTAESFLDQPLEKIEYKEPLDSVEFQSMIMFLEQLRNFEDLWSAIIEKGVKDGSITTSLKPIQLTHYIFILLNGIVDQMMVRNYILNKIKLSQEIIFTKTLQSISLILKS